MKRWMVWLVSVLTAAAVSFGILNLGSGPDEASASLGDRRACATPREAGSIELGMSRRQVQRIVDSPGWLVERSSEQGLVFTQFEYKACWSRQRHLNVFYVNNRVYGMALESGWWR